MKKTFAKTLMICLLALAMCVAMSACTVQVQQADGSPTVQGVAIEQGVHVVAALLMTLIGVLGTWLSGALARTEKLKGIAQAWNLVVTAAQQTVGELEQTTVGALKAANTDGKLDDRDIAYLKDQLYNKTMSKLDNATVELLTAAGADVSAIIAGAGEDMIGVLKLQRQAAGEA